MMIPIALAPAAAWGSIMGFGNFSTFTINQNDSGSAPTIPSSGTIELTNGGGEDRSIFANTPQNVSQFTASFTFQATDTNTFDNDPGAAFVIENDPRGAAAVGNTYAQYAFEGINKSIGVTLGLGSNSSGFFTDGSVSAGAANVSPVNLDSGDPIQVQLVYSGSTLTETLTDTVTSASFTTTDLVLTSIPTTVGGSTAFVGVTAGSGSQASELFSNFEFTNGAAVPEPSSLALLSIGAIGMLVCTLRRTRKSGLPAGRQ
jgi:hypothetical protein